MSLDHESDFREWTAKQEAEVSRLLNKWQGNPAKPEHQHLVPEFYLKPWCSDDRILLVNKDSGEAKEIGVRDAAVGRDFYTMRDDVGNKVYIIEHMLAELEQQVAPHWKAMSESGEVYSKPEFAMALAPYLAVQLCRTAKYRREYQEHMEFAFQEMARAYMGKDDMDTARHFLESIGWDPSEDLVDIVLAIVRGEDRPLGFHANELVFAVLRSVPDIADVLVRRPWAIIPADASLVTTDHPVILVRDPKTHTVKGTGVAGAGVIYAPISPTQVLVSANPRDHWPSRLDAEWVHAINVHSAYFAEKWLYAETAFAKGPDLTERARLIPEMKQQVRYAYGPSGEQLIHFFRGPIASPQLRHSQLFPPS